MKPGIIIAIILPFIVFLGDVTVTNLLSRLSRNQNSIALLPLDRRERPYASGVPPRQKRFLPFGGNDRGVVEMAMGSLKRNAPVPALSGGAGNHLKTFAL
uniref:Uncharacterized protein n=1 Tax=Candidatus Kentrum sp. SD TaxID=2126332 RepID=A0A451BKU2_9GAMM|nr:MAG: hypothetical protein BECKSD772F_GA0070984_10327 [Candidatus Kentron sp. SD]VFK43917.1 MAG: hypothetical protein BECKSD772E_GA0070983_10317 [Candidatus Kentron sp. SD]VFK78897.1 MAG: hypothetical protein BECKSD772D_GA0070982_10295 [Candidatus Kentron sp. SD]